MSQVQALPDPIAYCPFCAAKYPQEVMRVISRHSRGQIVFVACQSCGRAMLFAIEQRGRQMACLGVLTDCDAGEARTYLNAPKISLDQVLSLHAGLRKPASPGNSLT